MRKSKETNKIKIYKKDLFCGYLLRRNDGGAEFIYDEKYLASPQTPNLCFNIIKRKESYIQHGANLHPYFAGLLPEGLRLKYLVQKVKTSPDDLFSLFASIGHDCIGDVYALSDLKTEAHLVYEKPDKKAMPKWDEINFYDYFLSTLSEDIEQSEFAGVQEKISASMISLPITTRNKGFYILKLNPKDKQNLVYNEWACLKLAQSCGINVNDFQLIEDKNANLGLLVKRFDRVSIKGHFARVHQEDLCQVLNLFPSEKYRVALKDIVHALQEFSTAPLIETYNLIKLMTFSYLIGNGDMHAKNISLSESPISGQIGLTPAYDLICTLIYGDTKMALKLDAKDSNLKRKDLLNFGLRLGLSKETLESMMDDLLHYFYLNHHILFSIPMTEQKSNFLSHEILLRIKSLSSD